MPWLQEKYTKEYFLARDAAGKKLPYGVEGADYWERGEVHPLFSQTVDKLAVKRGVVLDIGHGRGECMRLCIERGAREVIGIDFSPAAAELARVTLQKFPPNKYELIQGDALEYARKQANQERFTHILMMDVIEHIPRAEVDQLVPLLFRMLAPGGVCVVHTPFYPEDDDVLVTGGKAQCKDTSDNFEATKGMHINRYSERGLEQQFTRFGFARWNPYIFIKPRGGVPVWKLRGLGSAFFAKNLGYRLERPKLKPREAAAAIRQFARRVRRRLKTGAPPPMVEPRWVAATGGPLVGHELFIDPSVETWGKLLDGKVEQFLFEPTAVGDLSGKIVWDVGVFMGYHAMAFAALVGDGGRVFAFEPNPANAARARLNLERNPTLAQRTTVLDMALSDADGQQTFIFSRDVETGASSGSHLSGTPTPEEQTAYRGFEQALVPTARADTLVAQGRVPAPALIKIDVEGAEELVLAGCKDVLASARPVLLVEIHHILTMLSVQKMLIDLGYEISVLDRDGATSSRCFILARPR